MTTLDELCALWADLVASPHDRTAIAGARARFDVLLDHVEGCDRCASLTADRNDLIELYEALALAGGEPPLDVAAVEATLKARADEEREVTTAVEDVLVPGLSAPARALYQRIADEVSPAQVFLGLDALALLLTRLPAGELNLAADGSIVRGNDVLVPRDVVCEEIARMAEIPPAAASSLLELAFAASRDNPKVLLGVEATPIGAKLVRLTLSERSAEEDLGARWLAGYAQRAEPDAFDVASRAEQGSPAPPIVVEDRSHLASPPGAEPAPLGDRADRPPPRPVQRGSSRRGDSARPGAAGRRSRFLAGGAALMVAAGALVVIVSQPTSKDQAAESPIPTDRQDNEHNGLAAAFHPSWLANGEVAARWGGTDSGLACLSASVAAAIADASGRSKPIVLNPTTDDAAVRSGSSLAAYVVSAPSSHPLANACTVMPVAQGGADGTVMRDTIVCDRAVFERIGRLSGSLAQTQGMAPSLEGAWTSSHLDGWLTTSGAPGGIAELCQGSAGGSPDAAPIRTATLLVFFELAHQRAHLTQGTTHRRWEAPPGVTCASEEELRATAAVEIDADRAALSGFERLAETPSGEPSLWPALANYLLLDEAAHWLPRFGAPAGRAEEAAVRTSLAAMARGGEKAVGATRACIDDLMSPLASHLGYGPATSPGPAAAGRCLCSNEALQEGERYLAKVSDRLTKAGFDVTATDPSTLLGDLKGLERAVAALSKKDKAELVIGSYACAPMPERCGSDAANAFALSHGEAIGVGGLVVHADVGEETSVAVVTRLRKAIPARPGPAFPNRTKPEPPGTLEDPFGGK